MFATSTATLRPNSNDGLNGQGSGRYHSEATAVPLRNSARAHLLRKLSHTLADFIECAHHLSPAMPATLKSSALGRMASD